MNINLNQKDSVVKATLTEGNNTLNYTIDIEEEKANRAECARLAGLLDRDFGELLKKNNNPTDDEKAAVIAPYITNPVIHLNFSYFCSLLRTNKLRTFINELGVMGKDEVNPTVELMEQIYGDKKAEEKPVEEPAPVVEEEKPVEEVVVPEPVKEEKPKKKRTTKKKAPAADKLKLEETQEEIDVPIKHDSIPATIQVGTPVLKIRYHKETYPDLPEVVKHGNFIDLYVAKGCKLKEGESKLIDLGISVECPEGYWMQLVPRSSTFKKYGIIQTNSFGVIDTSYCGDNDIVMLPVYATRNTQIPKGERICQFRLVRDIPFETVTVDKLEGPDRGGFGSTGKK